MSFLSRIFDRKRAVPVPPPEHAEPEGAPAGGTAAAAPDAGEASNGTTNFLQSLAERLDAEAAGSPAPVGGPSARPRGTPRPAAETPAAIPGVPSAEQLIARAAPQPAAAGGGRRSRTKTRLIGFDASQTASDDPFGQARTEAAPTEEAAPEAATGPAMFPVGWVLVVDGPGRGASFPVTAGMSPIGRGADQAVRLDFGDAAISRASHAAIVYDPDTREFLLGHGGKSNIVRLNGRPVISNEALKGGDEIRLGETSLRLVTLADAGFDWNQTGGDEDEDDDLEIA